MEYRRRVVDQVLDDLLPYAPAVAIEGAKGVGKTVTAVQRAKSTLDLDDGGQLAVLAADVDIIDRLTPPVLIDEWQLFPAVWDRVRRGVDRAPNDGGRYLTTVAR